MAEHENEIFEHRLKAKLEQLDAQIKIPEIPDAQGIFDRAESEKGRVIPFKKYSRYIAVAAAIALICVSIPVMGIFGGFKLGMSSNEAAPEMADVRGSDYFYAEDASSETAAEAAEEETETPEPKEYLAVSSSMASDELDHVNSGCSLPLDAALRVFFDTNAEKKHEIGAPTVESFSDNLNKKRNIEITLDDESISVILTDNSAEGDIIAAFWAEGIYQGSGLDEKTGNYVITLVKPVTQEDFESGNYLPAVGDAQFGSYTVPAEAIEIPGEVTEGVITLYIEIHPGTGEYKITGELK